MALAIDASTPAFAAAAADPWTTASFTPPVDSLLVAVVTADWFESTPTITVTSTGLTFTSRRKQGALNEGVVEIFTAEVGANGGSARTVSASTSLTADSGGLKVYVVTGQHATLYFDTTGGGSSTTNNITPTALTTGFDNCWVFGGGTEWQSLGIPTSTDVEEGYDDADLSLMCVRKSAATATAGAVTLNFDAAGTGAAQWTWAAISIRPAAGGTTFNQNVSGAVTQTGALSKLTSKPFAGTNTPTGAVAKRVAKTLAGVITPTGAVSNALVRLLSVAGTIAASGLLTRETGKAFAGAVAPTGALLKQAAKTAAGAISPSGSVANIKTILLSIAGVLAPIGALVKQARKPLSGALTPGGSLIKQTGKAFAGAIASGGAVAVTRLVFVTIAGVISPTGAVVKRIGKALDGSVDPTGALLKMLSRVLGGGITPAGASSHSLDIPQFNGTSTPSVTGLASAPQVTGLDAAASVTRRGSSTPTVSDG